MATSGRGQDSTVRLLRPQQERYLVPANGFAWMDEIHDDSCLVVPDSMWIRFPAKSFDLLISADGPHGSGRYWTIRIALAAAGESKPLRGICLSTSTIGWRTLQQFNTLPLPWASDRNGDGHPEIILWNSFPLTPGASVAEFGLTGWVYDVTDTGILSINWPLSRKLAAEVADAYRKPLNTKNLSLQKIRDRMADKLHKFAVQADDRE